MGIPINAGATLGQQTGGGAAGAAQGGAGQAQAAGLPDDWAELVSWSLAQPDVAAAPQGAAARPSAPVSLL